MNKKVFNRLLKKTEYDRSALSEIYEYYYPRIKIHIKRKFGKLVDSEDITEEVFLKLLNYRYTEPIKFPTAWLYKIAENIAINNLSAKKITVELTENISYDIIDEVITDMGVKEAILSLDELSRKVVYLHIWEDYTYTELAPLLGLSEPNARIIAHRAYKKIKKFL